MKLGRFEVHNDFFRGLNIDEGEGLNLFDGMVVLKAERDFIRDVTVFFAMHKSFRYVPEGEIPPTYRPVFVADKAVPTWEEVK